MNSLTLPLCLMVHLFWWPIPVHAEEKTAVQASARSDMAERLILEDAANRGFLGDSIKLEFRAPHSAVMRLYQIVKGEPKLVQSSKPTFPSKSFEIGYLFRPTGEKGLKLDFIYSDHDRPGKGPGGSLAIEQANPHPVLKLSSYTVLGMDYKVGAGETVVFHTCERGIERTDSLKSTSKKIGSGYVITSAIHPTGG